MLWAGALTGELVTDPEPGYWVRQAREPVRFADAVAALAAQGITVFLEIGPDGTLSAMGAGAVVRGPSSGRGRPGAQALAGALARAHVRGVGVDWAGGAAGGPPGGPADLRVPAAAVLAAAGRGRVSHFRAARFHRGMAVQRHLDTDPRLGAAVLDGTWLLVVPAGQAEDLAAWCTRALTTRGARVVTTQVGEPDRAGLTAQISSALAEVRAVVSLLAAGPTPAARTLMLVQALGDAQATVPVWALTRGAVSTGPADELTSPVQAQVWGIGRVAALEQPDRWGGLVDLPPAPDDGTGGRLASVLAGCGEDQVAIRSGGMLGRRLARAARPGASDGRRWAPGGTVLVTGGTGAIAGHVARWVVTRGATRVVLASRSGPAAPGSARTAATLAQAGAAVDVVACDITGRAAVAALLAAVTPPVSSIFHTAGVIDDGAVDELGTARLATVLAPKTAAAHLDELTRDLELDAFMLFSSIAATWGSGGQPGYAAGNAYLDALAQHRQARGLPATSVAWGPWAGPGIAGRDGTRLRRHGLRLLDPAMAITALGQILDGRDQTVTIADVDWDRFAPAFTLRRPARCWLPCPKPSRPLTTAASPRTAATRWPANWPACRRPSRTASLPACSWPKPPLPSATRRPMPSRPGAPSVTSGSTHSPRWSYATG